MKPTCLSLNKMMIMNYPIPTFGILHLLNIASKQDPRNTNTITDSDTIDTTTTTRADLRTDI